MSKAKSKKDSKNKTQSPGKNPQQKASFRQAKLYVLGAISVILLAAFGYGFWYTSQPSFCASCHSDQKTIESWEHSKHKEVNCNSCHWPGIVGSVKQKVSLVSETYSYYSETYTPTINKDGHVAKDIDDGTCVNCHGDASVLDKAVSGKVKKSQKTVSPVSQVNHQAHAKKQVSCTSCHNRVAHADLSEHPDNMKMIACFRCHGIDKTAKVPSKCRTCHSAAFDSKPVDHRSAEWINVVHAAESSGGDSRCRMCHQQNFCKNCHGIELPHKSDMRETHAELGNQNPNLCRKCHKGQDFCNSCHHYGFNGSTNSWLSYHIVATNQKGMQSCLECHKPTYCANCHANANN